ncbi:MAG: hydroxyquinol 1,2-dioxygenase, partial [Burkholderia sp.]|nr:hydroxyquinol 1,2-dioxygenase [Burkholderia sp.]
MATLETLDPSTGFAADLVRSTEADAVTGYRRFQLGEFEFQRDEYFVKICWPAKGQTRTHAMPADAFLRAMMRDVAWGFFYGWVNFDHVFGTRNHYGKVDMYAGTFNGILKDAGVDYTETFETPTIMATFKAMLHDWTNEGFDPFAAPEETGTAFGRKHGENGSAIERTRIATRRMPGLEG